MGQDYQMIEIVFLAAIAGFIAYRVYLVLGKRNGHERRRDPFAAREQVTEPRPAKGKADSAGPADRPQTVGAAGAAGVVPGSPIQQALTEIELADRAFEVSQFLGGARAAYGMILKAFADGDVATLKSLVTSDVLEAFTADIEGRASRGETREVEIVSIKDTKITGAKLEGRRAEITVTFEAELISATKNSDGAVVAGEPGTVVHVIDIWSFTRDLKSKGPEWLLSATDTSD